MRTFSLCKFFIGQYYLLILKRALQQPSMAEPKAMERDQVPGNNLLHCWSLFRTTSTKFFLSSPSVFPGCGIPHSPLFGSVDLVPRMKDSGIVPPVTVVQPSLPPHLEMVVRFAATLLAHQTHKWFQLPINT